MPCAASNRQAVFFHQMMQVRVLPFGVLKDWLEPSAAVVELREGATVADLLDLLGAGRPTEVLHSIAVSVNAEYATASHVLREGDEVGLLPPVPGGSTADQADPSDDQDGQAAIVTALTRSPIDAEELVRSEEHTSELQSLRHVLC